MGSATNEQLRDIAKRLRIHSLQMTSASGSGHPTTCLSMAEIASVLFFDEIAYNKEDPQDPANDEIILSKGHAAPILWAAYAEAGILPKEELLNLRKIDSNLEGHPTPRMPWIKAATGSLGQGLSIGVGIAMAQTRLESPGRTYVVLGDGELAEGSVWEAAALASHYNVNNLVAIVDANRLGQSGESLHDHDVAMWGKKFQAFGWVAIGVDGHDIEALKAAFADARTHNTPVAIIAKTFKGKGISFAENKIGWHGKALKGEDLEKALAELGDMPNVDSASFVRSPDTPCKKPSSEAASLAPPEYSLGEKVTTRQAYGTAITKLGSHCSNLIVLDAETRNSTFAQNFMDAHPQNYVECFIAEQNMIGMAVGLTAKGFKTFSSSFGAFLTRAHDQIRMAGHSNSSIKIVGSHVGVSIGADGGSQMALEDLGMMRPILNAAILYPCDGVSTERCTELLANHPHMGYMRITREKTPILYNNDEEFKIGGSKVLKEGDAVTIVAAGITVHEALKAREQLEQEGIHATLIDAYSVKPLDKDTIIACAKKTNGKILVVEDHFREAGLGEAVSLETYGNGFSMDHLCVRESPRSGQPQELLNKHKIDAAAIKEQVKQLVQRT